MSKLEGGLRSRGVGRSYEPGKPVVTIMTVVYNDASNIEKIICGVLAQTYKNIEYIIIDGGSSDRTVDIIRGYEDQIDYWLSEKDKGIYDAMNKGVSLATGEWVNFMNAGDSFYSDHTVEEVLSSLPPFADIVYGHTYYKEQDKMTLIETYSLECLWMSMICSHQSIFARTNLLKQHPFDLKYRISSDFEFIYHSYVTGRNFHDTQQVIAVHAVDGVSEQRIIKRMMERWSIVRKYTPSTRVNLFYFKLFWQKVKRTLRAATW